MPRISVGGASSGGGGYTSGYGFQHPASAGVMATLRRGTRSTAVSLVSDSTGTDTDEWFGILGYKLAAKFPAYTFWWRQWNDTTKNYDMPQVLQQGTGVGGGERYAELSSGAMRFVYSTAQTGDQDIRAKILPTDGWAPGGSPTRVVISRWDATGTSRGWYVWLSGDGKINYQYSADGTNSAANIVSTAAVPFADGTAGFIRVTHDVNNGASGHDVTFYTSTDGTTYTQLGSVVTTATATTIGNTTTDVRVGGINSTPTNFFNGKVYWVEYRPGTLAGSTPPASVIPPLIEDWDQPTTGPSVQTFGAPILTFVAGAQSGQSLSVYFDDATIRPKLLQKHGQDLHFISTNHNEGNLTNERWLSAYAQHVTNTKSALPSVPLVALTQNPTMPPGVPQYQVNSRSARGAALMTWAASQTGVYGLDIYQAYPSDFSSLVESDGIHPTQGNGGTSGSDLWANYVYAQMFS